MSEIIQCPECDKKFRLPENPPATFTCNNCGTLMDLSDFGGQAAPEPEPEAEPAPTERPGRRRSRGGGAGRTRRSRARGGAAAASAAAPGRGGSRRGSRGPARRSRAGGGRRSARGGRGRAAPEDEYDDDAGEGRGRGRGEKNNTVLIGAIAALAVAIVLVIVVATRDKSGATQTGGGEKADGPAAAGGDLSAQVPTGPGGKELTAQDAPPAGEGSSGRPKPKAGGRIRLSKLELQTFDWPDAVDADTRAKVEEAIKNLYLGGRDGVEASEYLVAQGRPICGRLISEFKTIEDGMGLESREARSRLGALDAVLRQIDGWIERRWKERKKIKAPSAPTFVLAILKRWTYWWQSDEWKTNERKPWDPWEDESDDSADGMKPPEDEPEKPGGFDKPAGR